MVPLKASGLAAVDMHDMQQHCGLTVGDTDRTLVVVATSLLPFRLGLIKPPTLDQDHSVINRHQLPASAYKGQIA